MAPDGVKQEHESLAGVERLRVQLQDSAQTLQKGLRHWQTWEAEYEGLKEELQDLPSNTSENELSRIAEKYEGDLITEKEIKELFGQDNGWLRSPRQIVGLIDRRIDYVQRNVETLKKQLDEADRKLENIAVIIQPEARNEDGLPVQDIYEELDDEGNVISSRLSIPGDAESHILGVLEKAGLQRQDVPTGDGAEAKRDDPQTKGDGVQRRRAGSILKQPSPPFDDPSAPSTPLRSRAKSVSFAVDVKEEPAATPPAIPTPATAVNTAPLGDLAKGSFTDADRVVELDEYDEPIAAQGPRQPVNESFEAAQLRRRMLEYNLREVGEIVAEMNIDEDDQDDDDDDRSDSVMDEDDNYDDEYVAGADAASATSSTDDENEYGMSRSGVMTEAYKKEMLKLEQRLRARVFENVGPAPADLPSDMERPSESSAPASESTKASGSETTTISGSEEKGVRFAKHLDIAPVSSEPSVSPTESRMQADNNDDTPPIKDTIIESSAKPVPDLSAPASTRKPSRFKMSRQAEPASPAMPAPHRSTTNPLASQIIERPAKAMSAIPDNLGEVDEFDPVTHKQQIAAEYYQKRNKMVAQEGGFSRRQYEELDDEDAEITDDDEVPKKKVSLFKAARVRGTRRDN